MFYKCFYLVPEFGNVRSYYGKARVTIAGTKDNYSINLWSYDTRVSTYDSKTGKVKHLGKWSRTTTRHQKEFEKQFAKGI